MPRPFNLYFDASPLTEDRITGIPHFTAELIKALDRHPENGRTFRLRPVIAFDKRKKLARWDFASSRVRIIPLPARVLNLVWKYRLLPPMDLLLGRGFYVFPNYRNWPLSGSSRSLTYIHDLGFVRYPQFVQPKNLHFLKSNIHRWIRRADLVLTGSDHARDEIVNLLGAEPANVVRIYHGVDHDAYYPRSSEEIKSTKTKYSIDGDYLLYVGSLEPRKNLVRLIHSYADLPRKLRDKYSLCLAGGGGWLNEEIMEAIAATREGGLNVIRPDKYVEDADLPALMSGASLLVHPALYEGFGLSPLQAMACGTPVLVGDNSSLPEIVGEAGVLADAESESDISAKIEKVLTDTKYRSGLVKAGLVQSRKFRWDTSADELLNCIDKLK